MKRLFLALGILLLSSLQSFAQEDHLKFMGIPLDGTIKEFRSKLEAKGVYSEDLSYEANNSVGVESFKGSFAGNDAEIYVYYDESTKMVYRAKAVIKSKKEKVSENTYYNMTKSLTTKYGDAESKIGKQDGYETMSYFIPDNNPESTYLDLGKINVYRINYHSESYDVHVDYIDTKNNIKHEKKNMDDL